MSKKLVSVLLVALSLAACASDVSQEEIDRAEHQPYDDESDVAVTTQALGAVETIPAFCAAGCAGSFAVTESVAAVVTQSSGPTIRRMSIGSNQVTDVVTPHNVDNLTIASDSTFYYSHRAPGGNHRIQRLDGSVPVQVAIGVGAIRHMKVDDTNLYFVDDRGLVRQPRSGSAAQILATGVGTLFGVDSTRLYFSNSAQTELRQIKTDGHAPRLITTTGAARARPEQFAQDANHLYFALNAAAVMRFRKGTDGPFTRTDLWVGARNINELTTKDGKFYFVDIPYEPAPLELQGYPDPIAPISTGGIWQLRIAGNYLYWHETTSTGQVLKRVRL